MSTRLTPADVTICVCEEDHVTAITTIYAYHVLHGLASFEIEPPSEDDMRRRRLDIVSRNYPYLVAECAGEVVGYAYASPYRLRPAYRHTAENSVYLHPAWAGRGIGRRLMSALLAECEARGVAANRDRHRRQRELRFDRPP
jgi:L-amino acid N-acyltransferase YncA